MVIALQSRIQVALVRIRPQRGGVTPVQNNLTPLDRCATVRDDCMAIPFRPWGRNAHYECFSQQRVVPAGDETATQHSRNDHPACRKPEGSCPIAARQPGANPASGGAANSGTLARPQQPVAGHTRLGRSSRHGQLPGARPRVQNEPDANAVTASSPKNARSSQHGECPAQRQHHNCDPTP